MICKWCGETIKAGNRTCRRCKREIPALSDCGGFYDLVSKDAPTPACAPAPQSAAQSPVQPVIPQRRLRPQISQIWAWMGFSPSQLGHRQTWRMIRSSKMGMTGSGWGTFCG